MTNRGENVEPLVDIQKIPITEPRPIWFVYAGMGSQWPGKFCHNFTNFDVKSFQAWLKN
jgi:hypothetical protein